MADRPRHPDNEIEAAIAMLKDLAGQSKRELVSLMHGDCFCVLTMTIPVGTGSFVR